MTRFAVCLLLAAVALIPGVFAEPAGMAPVDQKTACLQCHGDLSPAFDLPNRHKPLDLGRCSACHNPHAARHSGLLQDNQAALCSKCHTEAAAWKTKPTVHDPVREGQCIACHDPHASAQKALLKTKFQDLCATCHPAVKDWSARARLHSPVRQGDCTRCHTAHASDVDNLLVAAEGTLCLECHQVTPTFTDKHKGFNPATSKCSACHDPHAGSGDNFLMANKHMPFENGECSACHQTAASAAGYPLKTGGTLAVCASCHDAEAGDVQRYAAHGATTDKACEMCHNAHASDERALLAAPQKRLCTRCHDPFQKSKDTKSNPHLNNGCTSCHAPHGSGQPYYLVKEPLETCAQCHSREHHVSHPMGEKATDPLTHKPLDCLSCHTLHGSDFEKLLVADGNRDLCVRCHAR